MLSVALGENVKENRSILLWALQNSGGKKICIIHVHQPAQMIPFSKLPSYKYARHIYTGKRFLHKQILQNTYIQQCWSSKVPICVCIQVVCAWLEIVMDY